MNSNELAHRGVMGMKWGHRSGSGSSDGISNKKYFSNIAKAKKGEHIDAPDSKRTTNLKKNISNTKLEIDSFSSGAKDKKGKTIVSDKGAKKIQDWLKGDLAKTEVKLIKSKYADEYNAGLSKVGKILTKITASDKTYGEMMYNLHGQVGKEYN